MNNNDIFPWDKTPNLSGFNGSFQKTYKAKKQPKGLNKLGKKTIAWQDGRQELKEVFKENGITSCEIKGKDCKNDNFLGFAHVRRRNTLTPEQITDPHFVVLACQPDHEFVDFKMKNAESEKLLNKIIKERGW